MRFLLGSSPLSRLAAFFAASFSSSCGPMRLRKPLMQLVTSRVGSSSRVRSAILRFSWTPALGRRLGDLVADRVHDHRRVVDVLGDHRCEVPLPPLLELRRRCRR